MSKKYHLLIDGILALCLLLAIALAVNAARAQRQTAYQLEEHYQGALLSALSELNELQLHIDKALLCADTSQSARLLGRISSDAAAVHSGLSALPLNHNALYDTAKLCNQVSDYASMLLQRPETADAQTLSNLSDTCVQLESALRRAYGQMRTGNLTLSKDHQPLSDALGSLDYPTLIYDGPFSDIVSEQSPRGLGTDEVSADMAVMLAADFVGESAENAQLTQESGGSIPAYGVEITASDCVLQLAITKTGGKVLWMFPENAAFAPVYGLEEARAAAERFLEAHGYAGMELTFWQLYGGMATMSFAAAQEGVLLYPDLIKVQVRLDTLSIVGWEARHYLSSHETRQNLTPAISEEEAQGAVSEQLSITASRLCLIPQDGKEILSWEFMGEYENDIYYVYIDATTGQQRDIQRLVQDETGLKSA